MVIKAHKICAYLMKISVITSISDS